MIVIKNCVNPNKNDFSKCRRQKVKKSVYFSRKIFIHSNHKIMMEFFQKNDKILLSQICFDKTKIVINQSKELRISSA